MFYINAMYYSRRKMTNAWMSVCDRKWEIKANCKDCSYNNSRSCEKGLETLWSFQIYP